ncbi:ADP-ribosylglycohydrolase family protein [Catalinimonas niigatensis]|uniref:ADP-ribosylglycohydrolase family protein n=1 Tax=Catalinimonas niigatensis TaxID=1397264 RepID=UPI002665A5B7|nr:ADP-ribosylglycohydrolase family protein [Catalinimonas niigatensis]WPP51389.1 ADP-ribosylglycohydrolase family protein [Catalinimonas niigatensis]
MLKITLCILLFLSGITFQSNAQHIEELSEAALRDKIKGYWIGQLVGNYLGFPFENLYTDTPIPILIDQYYDFRALDTIDLKMNHDDRRAYVPIMAGAMGGAWSDDDTDIEFVTLHAVEKYGLDLTYEEITLMWKKHINRFIWSANRRARDLMEEGLVPPATGSKQHNPYWYRITSQLVNEIWSAFYPGMTKLAGQRAEWGAHIMCDDWATHVTRAYGVMYSAAFFEKDVNKLVALAINDLPEDSPYRRGLEQLVRWHEEHEDWRATRQLIHDHYYQSVDGFDIEFPVAGSVVNGLSGVMALLYGEGDFTKTVAIATSAGYDCDNQAATIGGLMGVMQGASAIPEYFTLKLNPELGWTEPFNNQYINYSRDGLSNYNTIRDIVDRIMAITEEAIQSQGAEVEVRGDEKYFIIPLDF